MDLSEAGGAEGAWYDDIKFELIKRVLGDELTQSTSVIDVGCGQGGILRRVGSAAPRAHRRGYDPFLTEDFIQQLKSEGIEVGTAVPENVEPASVVLLMDVLEHVSDPQTLLREALDLTAPGGVLLITVPAYRWLWSSHDVALGHHDRYTRKRLKALIATSDARIEQIGYALPLLMMGAAPVRLAERAKKTNRPATSQVDDLQDGALTRVLGAIGKREGRLFGGRSPFGLTCVAVVRPR